MRSVPSGQYVERRTRQCILFTAIALLSLALGACARQAATPEPEPSTPTPPTHTASPAQRATPTQQEATPTEERLAKEEPEEDVEEEPKPTPTSSEIREEVDQVAMELTSSAFAPGEPIPMQYTCDGEDLSPPLTWENAPAGTEGFALISDDPDAPGRTWVHWVLYAIPPSATGLEEGVPTSETLPDGAVQGTNDFNRIGYGGPCPPPGSPHRYFFKLYALDATLSLAPGATKQELLEAMEGHILAEAELMGTYQRR